MITASLEHATLIPMAGPRKAALKLALRFEEAILASGPGERVFGPEQRLVEGYGSSPKVVRQALRILESRFLGFVRRGVQGGLVLRKPDLTDSAELMAIYLCATSVDQHEVVEAMDMLLPEMTDRSTAAQSFVTGLLRALERSLDDSAPQPQISERLRSLAIARHIVSDHKAHVASGKACMKLGTLTRLEEAYGSGRPVIVQAIRILEELEIVESRPGRNGGIVMRQPSPGAVVRAVYAHLVLGDLTCDMAKDIIWSINRANAVRAARVITGEQIALLDQVVMSLQSDQGPGGDHSAEITLWRMLGDITGNKIIHMLVRCLFYFRVRSLPSISAYLARPASETIRANACDIARIVCAKQPDRARQAIMCGEALSREDMNEMAA